MSTTGDLWLVLCYDISDNRRRGRVFRRLKGFLVPVQESVFEGELPGRRWAELLRMLERELHPGLDSVRIYQLPASHRGLTTLVGNSPRVEGGGEAILV